MFYSLLLKIKIFGATGGVGMGSTVMKTLRVSLALR